MSFRENECRGRSGHAADNVAVLRHVARNLLQRDATAKVGVNAAWDDDDHLKVLAHSSIKRPTGMLYDQGVSITTGQLPGTIRSHNEPQERRIRVRDDLLPVEACSTLFHETGHHLAGHQAGIEWRDAEAVAESSAEVVLAHLGLDTAAKSFP